MTKPQKGIVGAVALGLLGLIVYSTMQQSAFEYEVCVNYKGRVQCAKAAGRTAEEAVSTGQQMGCALVSEGRDENIACLAAPPASVKQVR